jgi:hypothetical protein
MPTFTNPNNVSIVTGVEPVVHGICGNYALDQSMCAFEVGVSVVPGQSQCPRCAPIVGTGEEVMLTDPRHLKCGTVLAALQRAGAVVGIITAKDKLLRLLSGVCECAGRHPSPSWRPLHCVVHVRDRAPPAGLDPASALLVSVEKAAAPATAASLQRFGVSDMRDLMGGAAAPGIYDANISVYALQLGAAWLARVAETPEMYVIASHALHGRGRLLPILMSLHRQDKPVVLYVSTTDYVQHKYGPHAPEAIGFYRYPRDP